VELALELDRAVARRPSPNDPAEIEADGIADPVSFWSGFAHGVRWYLLEKRQLLLDRQAPKP
jgi:hypothetical protein